MIRFLRKYVFHNFWLKLISLAAAVLLWMAVAREPIAEVAVTVPIEFTHVPENLEISSEKIPEAQIRVRGPSRSVRNLTPSQVHASVDLHQARPGERTYDQGDGLQITVVPRDVQVVQVVPTQLRLNFDVRDTRTVTVRPRVIGTFASGFHIVQVVTDPPEVVIQGPRQRVDNIDAAITDPVDATGVVGFATFSGVHVYVSDPLVRVLQPSAVRVTVITEKAESRGRKSQGQ
jgi:YbbR domain-containing protein